MLVPAGRRGRRKAGKRRAPRKLTRAKRRSSLLTVTVRRISAGLTRVEGQSSVL